MREDALQEFLKRAKSDWTVIEQLLKEDKLVESEYEEKNSI